MQINTNGKRNITLDFDAPKKFKLKKDGAEIPYIRTGKNSFRLGRNIDGVLDLEEVIEQPRIVKPMQLQAQQMALVNPNDVLMINQAAQQLEIEQNLLSETQKRAEKTQAYLDIQQQKINESVLSVQGLENDNAERITATENGIFNLAGNLATTEQNLVYGIGVVKNELQEHKTAENPHGITKETIGLNKVDNTSDLDKPISKAVQSALDEKADKDEIQAIRDELGEYQEKNDRFTNALSNYTGGLAGNQLPDGGLEGQILAKRSDMSGDAEWVNSSASIKIDDGLSLESENPVQNKVITSNIFALQTSKQDVISDLATIRSGSALGATSVQPSELESYTTKDYVDDGLSGKQDKLTQTQLDAVNSGANTTNIGHIATNTSDIADINALIPNQATTQNQLADKSFVNSSINNIAAFYITSDVAGDPFTTREALIAGPYYFRGEIRTPTQNDYALVSEDETHDDLTSRFMYDGGQWVWQYTLNNTKFTQAQIDAINSGITNGLVAKISTNETTINNHIANTSNPHSVTKAQVGLSNVDNTSDLNKPISTATQTALNGKQDTISDLATIRSGAVLGATAVQPSDLATVATSGSYNDLSNKPDLNGKANIDLSNITSEGKNIANWSTNVTNCITEIPQDIKLELNNGTLTLKAGSKVYVPNGAGVFDEVIVSSDKNLTLPNYGTQSNIFIFYRYSYKNIIAEGIVKTFSGSSAPTNFGGNYAIWYDTTNNKIMRTSDGGSTWSYNGCSFPVCIVSTTSGVITSIDQVFNGFGYIGSTVFALPGVKGLIPNGRNEDGSLKNIEYTVPNVILFTQNIANVNSVLIGNTKEFDSYLNQSEFLGNFSSDNIPAPSGNWGSYYNSTENQFYIFYENVWNKTNRLKCADITWADGKITSFTPKTAFHSVDYNDFSDLKDTVDINDSNVVHKTGNEIVSGVKTFIDNIQRNVNVIRGQTPATSSWDDIKFVDNNGNWLAGFEYNLNTDKSSSLDIILSDSVSNTTNIITHIALHVLSDGTSYVESPASDVNGSIVTTLAKSKTQNGYFKFGNGLIIQWGLVTNMSNNKALVGFPTPFTAVPQVVTTSDKDGVTDGYNSYVSGITTTGFNVYNKMYGSNLNCWVHWIAIGY